MALLGNPALKISDKGLFDSQKFEFVTCLSNKNITLGQFATTNY